MPIINPNEPWDRSVEPYDPAEEDDALTVKERVEEIEERRDRQTGVAEAPSLGPRGDIRRTPERRLAPPSKRRSEPDVRTEPPSQGPSAPRQRTVTASADDLLEDADRSVQSVREKADDRLREATGGRVGVSEDFTSREDSGGVTNVVDTATGGYLGETYEEGRKQITPHAAASLSEPEAIKARLEKERQIYEQAEEGVSDIGSVEAPSASELSSIAFVGGETLERVGIDAGRRTGEAIDVTSRVTGRMANPVGGSPFRDVQVGEETAGEFPGNVAEEFVASGAMGAGAVLQAPSSVIEDVRADEQSPTELEGGYTGAGRTFAESQAQMARERPLTTAALLALPAAEAGPAAVRGYRSTRGTKRTVAFEDITSPRGAAGELPEFRTSPDAPTSKAVSEVKSRARDQPETVQEAVGTESVLYHSSERPLPADLDVATGRSELPGLFTSPDASPLRLREGRQTASLAERLRPSKPDLSTTPDRLAAFEGDRIAAMPEWARGEGRIRDPTTGEYVPDPSTSGARFMTEQADPGTAYVKPSQPRGSRTSELEAIFPPESRFAQAERIGVEMPSGRTLGVDVFRRTGDQASRAGTETPPRSMAAESIGRSYTSRPSSRTGPTAFSYATALGGSTPRTIRDETGTATEQASAVGTDATREVLSGSSRRSGRPTRASDFAPSFQRSRVTGASQGASQTTQRTSPSRVPGRTATASSESPLTPADDFDLQTDEEPEELPDPGAGLSEYEHPVVTGAQAPSVFFNLDDGQRGGQDDDTDTELIP